jgi:hypothetical protein
MTAGLLATSLVTSHAPACSCAEVGHPGATNGCRCTSPTEEAGEPRRREPRSSGSCRAPESGWSAELTRRQLPMRGGRRVARHCCRPVPAEIRRHCMVSIRKRRRNYSASRCVFSGDVSSRRKSCRTASSVSGAVRTRSTPIAAPRWRGSPALSATDASTSCGSAGARRRSITRLSRTARTREPGRSGGAQSRCPPAARVPRRARGESAQDHRSGVL